VFYRAESKYQELFVGAALGLPAESPLSPNGDCPPFNKGGLRNNSMLYLIA